MKREKIIALILVVALSCGALIYAQATALTVSKVQWEYMVYPATGGNMTFNINQGNVPRSITNFVDEMNKLGAEGWEIIEVGSGSVILKRPKQTSQNQ